MEKSFKAEVALGVPPSQDSATNKLESKDNVDDSLSSVKDRKKSHGEIASDDVGLPSLEELENMSSEELEDLFNKNTPSFRCLAQILISRSSFMKSALYWFPPLEDPGLDAAFNYQEPDHAFVDGLGLQKYLYLCEQMNIVPISRVKKSLDSEELNLKYYGLSLKQIKAISEALIINNQIKKVILQENWLTPEMVFHIGEVLRENNTIHFLDMRECRIGPKGARSLNEGINTTQCLRELDLSFNVLGNAGIRALSPGLRENVSIKKLNLSHNSIGEESSKAVGRIIKENIGIEELDLSWNDFYTEIGMANLCEGLVENLFIRILNLSWNGISTKEAMLPLLQYMKSTECLEEIFLNNNQLSGVPLKIARSGAMACTSLQKLYIGNNNIDPEEALSIAEIITNQPDSAMEYIDMENTFVTKKFIPVLRTIRKMGKDINIEGILSNYRIKGPDINKLYFERCKALAMKPKKKKMKKDFGQFMFFLPESPVSRQDFQILIKKFKIKKLDKDLVEGLVKRFPAEDQKVDVVGMRKAYLERYPDTVPPETKKKKKKKKGKKTTETKEGKEKKEGEETEGETSEAPTSEAPSPPAKDETLAEGDTTAEGKIMEGEVEGTSHAGETTTEEIEGERTVKIEDETIAQTEGAGKTDGEEKPEDGDKRNEGRVISHPSDIGYKSSTEQGIGEGDLIQGDLPKCSKDQLPEEKGEQVESNTQQVVKETTSAKKIKSKSQSGDSVKNKGKGKGKKK